MPSPDWLYVFITDAGFVLIGAGVFVAGLLLWNAVFWHWPADIVDTPDEWGARS